jgi:hypothetical protein
MITLKECPFCLSNQVVFISNVDSGGRDCEFVVCLNDECLCDGPIGKSKEEAAQKWNKIIR